MTTRAVSSSRPALFCDRDGVVNVSPGPGYVLSWAEFRFQPRIEPLLAGMKAKGYCLVLVTSQKGVGKGLMSPEALEEIHRRMQTHLAAHNAAFDAVYVHTGLPGDPVPPKPNPGMLLTAARDLSLDLARSWLVGDADRDIQLGQAANLGGTIAFHGEKRITAKADRHARSLADLEDILARLPPADTRT